MSASLTEDAARIFGRIDMSSECWLWTGAVTKDGYGKSAVGSRAAGTHRDVAVHRWVYEYIVGEIPADLQIDHLCHVRHCANPAHLEPVTLAVNQGRKWAKREPQDLCGRGLHRLTETAKFNRASGKRYCGVCCAEKKRASRLTRLGRADEI